MYPKFLFQEDRVPSVLFQICCCYPLIDSVHSVIFGNQTLTQCCEALLQYVIVEKATLCGGGGRGNMAQ